MIRSVQWRHCWLGCQKEVSRNQGQWGHGQQLSLRPLRGLWARAAAGLQLSGRLWAGRSLGLEEGGAGNVELALAQSGLRAVYSRTLGISRAFPQGTEQLRVCEMASCLNTADGAHLGCLSSWTSLEVSQSEPCSRSPPCPPIADPCPVTLRCKHCSMLSLWLDL